VILLRVAPKQQQQRRQPTLIADIGRCAIVYDEDEDIGDIGKK